MKTVLDIVASWGESPSLTKGNIMDTIGSIITIALVVAAIVIPQALSLYLSDWRKAEREEYIPDGR